MNIITIIGNLVHTPKLSQTASGVAMLTFTVADNERVKGEEHTSFFDCTMFRQRAETIGGLNLGGGTKVAVAGKMQQRKYEKDGQRRTAWSVLVENVQILSPRGSVQEQAPVSDPQDAGVPDYRPDLPAIDDGDLPF